MAKKDELRGMLETRRAELRKEITDARWQFEMSVEACSLEVTQIAKDISSAIGEISVYEAKLAIIKEFSRRLLEG
jgi:hypothetical protein